MNKPVIVNELPVDDATAKKTAYDAAVIPEFLNGLARKIQCLYNKNYPLQRKVISQSLAVAENGFFFCAIGRSVGNDFGKKIIMPLFPEIIHFLIQMVFQKNLHEHADQLAELGNILQLSRDTHRADNISGKGNRERDPGTCTCIFGTGFGIEVGGLASLHY